MAKVSLCDRVHTINTVNFPIVNFHHAQFPSFYLFRKILRYFLSFIFLYASTQCFAGMELNHSSVAVCFTPGGSCTKYIIDAIHNAHKSLLIQAYQFTSPAIEEAVVDAKRRNVDVKVILDKSQYSAKKFSSAMYFTRENIPVWIDNKVNIAHNKVMVIDNNTVITGSFNFTKNAQEHNAENLIIIQNPELANIYMKNWNSRLAASTSFDIYENMPHGNHHKKNKRSHKQYSGLFYLR